VIDERLCAAVSNLQDHTFLEVWDFGDDDTDIKAARIAEDEAKSEDEDNPSGIEDNGDEDAIIVDATAGLSLGTRSTETTLAPYSAAFFSPHCQIILVSVL